MLSTLKQSEFESELNQAHFRFIISFSSFLLLNSLYFLFGYDFSMAIFIVGTHFLYTSISYYFIKKNILPFSFRKKMHILADTGVLSFSFLFSSIYILAFYPLYMWVIIANGMRFGTKDMIFALISSVVGLKLFTSLNPIFYDHSFLINGFCLSLIFLTLGFYKVVKRHHSLNENLENEVATRTKELQFHLEHDKLTLLKNRNALQKKLEDNHYKYILLFDIIDFQKYNDLFGVVIGDEILVQFSNWLATKTKNKDDIFRIYGDGFILLSNDKKNINSYLEKFFIKVSSYGDIFIEMRVAILNTNDVVDNEYLERLNMTMKYAKNNKLKMVEYSDKINSKKDISTFLYWKNEIEKALKEDRFEPFYQPIVDRTGKVIKYESLIRMKQIKDDNINFVSPFFFLDVAINSGLYHYITKIVVQKTLDTMMLVDKDFSINLSYSDINNPKTCDFLEKSIVEKGCGDRIIFEILESEDVKDYEVLTQFIGKFKSLGVRIAIDDFGSGFSNYNHLLKLKPNFLKIDGSLVKNICHDKDIYSLVKSIVSFANDTNIKTIFEFVSDQDIFEKGLELGGAEFQGYYFSEPLEAKKIIDQNAKKIGSLDRLINVGEVQSMKMAVGY